jgi:hypothetical protein
MPKIIMRVEGLKFVLDKLDYPHLIGPSWSRAMTKALAILRGEVNKNAPMAKGTLKASLTDKIDPRPVPMWGLITANAESAGGVRYPFVLQAGHREHRRTSPLRRAGRNLKQAKAAGLHTTGMVGGEIILRYHGTRRSTRGWITKGLRVARQEMTGLLEQAAREIERRWGS